MDVAAAALMAAAMVANRAEAVVAVAMVVVVREAATAVAPTAAQTGWGWVVAIKAEVAQEVATAAAAAERVVMAAARERMP